MTRRRRAALPQRLLGLLTPVLMAAGVAACAGYAGGAGPARPHPDALVTYRVSGGIAGVDERLVVSRDGHVVHTSSQAPPERGRLTPDELAALVAALAMSDFATLPPDTVDPNVADAFVYEVSHDGHRVRTSDGNVPDRLVPVLDRLAAVLSGLGSDPLDGRTFVAETVTEHGRPRPPVGGTQIVLSFPGPGDIAAEAGCNAMSGPVDIGPDRLVVGDVAMTRMSCGPELDRQDAWLSGLLERDPSYTLAGARLRLEVDHTVIELVER